MTTDQLRAFLDAHGVPGAPTEDGFYAVQWGRDETGTVDVARVDGPNVRGSLGTNWSISRHAPLPDPTAMESDVEHYRSLAIQAANEKDAALVQVERLMAEMEALRGRVEDLDMRSRTGCGDCLGTGEGEGVPCETCNGDGWIRHRRFGRVSP